MSALVLVSQTLLSFVIPAPLCGALWDAAEDLLINDNLDAVVDYKSAMKWLAEVSGSKFND